MVNSNQIFTLMVYQIVPRQLYRGLHCCTYCWNHLLAFQFRSFLLRAVHNFKLFSLVSVESRSAGTLVLIHAQSRSLSCNAITIASGKLSKEKKLFARPKKHNRTRHLSFTSPFKVICVNDKRNLLIRIGTNERWAPINGLGNEFDWTE
jgi:hypothetical protein